MSRWLNVLMGVVLLLASPFFVSGNGFDDETQPDPPDEESSGTFHASIGFPHDVVQGNVFYLRVQIFPSAEQPDENTKWPGIGIYHGTNKAHEVMIRVLCQVKGVHSAKVNTDWTQHHDKTQLHESRLAEAREYAWNLLSQHNQSIIVENPELSEDPDYKAVGVDVYIIVGGQKVSFADMLVKAGHGMVPMFPGQQFDWGGTTVPAISE